MNILLLYKLNYNVFKITHITQFHHEGSSITLAGSCYIHIAIAARSLIDIGGYGNPGIGVPSVDDCEGGRWKTRIQYTYWFYISKQYGTDQDIFN